MEITKAYLHQLLVKADLLIEHLRKRSEHPEGLVDGRKSPITDPVDAHDTITKILEFVEQELKRIEAEENQKK